MSIALHNKQLLAFVLLALVTALVISYFLLYTVAHIDVWHLLLSFSPGIMYPH